jgi:hypothetical protein
MISADNKLEQMADLSSESEVNTIMNNQPQYVKAVGVYYKGVLQDVKKHINPLQPIFEAFTNSLEAINLRADKIDNGTINITIYSSEITKANPVFEELVIEDTGIGFTEKEFERFTTYKDNEKGFNNRGSGRIQLIHFFDEAKYISIYKTDNGFRERHFIISKKDKFINQNSITFLTSDKPVEAIQQKTILVLKGLLTPSEVLDNLTAVSLKEALTLRYMRYFCANRNKLPEIKIQYFLNTNIQEIVSISSSDIPEVDKVQTIKLHYSEISSDGRSIEKTSNKEEFNIQCFKIVKEKLDKNSIKLTSKDEIIDKNIINLDCLSTSDFIDNKRYLFLISSSYIDNLDGNVRGNIKLFTKEEFKRENNLFEKETILLDDLKSETNKVILNLYPEISKKVEEHRNEIEKLKSMFLINDETIKDLSFSLNDSEGQILEKVYTAEAKVIAQKDAKIKESIDSLDDLDPCDVNFEQELNKTVTELVKQIPLQNRASLTHYIARRKLVISLFDKILDNRLKVQAESKRNIDEKLLHNLIFKQHSDNPGSSDLWLVNEDFIYFKGTSEGKLGEILIDNVKIMKEILTPEEEKYKNSLEENRYEKRPDVLLFPNEGKCIIVEFKNPDKNVSDHLNQITNYASLIHNLSKDEYKFHTFYGYLVGERLDADDIQNKDSAFIHAFNFGYVFKPHYRIIGKFGREDGSLYTEAIQYSTLLERAEKRNEIFLKNISTNK